jgi:hypothetical protein
MNIAELLLILALIGFVIARRFAGQPLGSRYLVVPLGVTIWGGYQLRDAHLTATDIVFLLVSAVVGLAVGAVRGLTIQLYSPDGYLWQRYRLATLAVWGAGILLRAGLAAVGHLAGVHLAGGATIIVTLGVSLLAEAGVVGARAVRTGVPFAPRRRDMVAGRR